MQRYLAVLACTLGIASLTHAQSCLPGGLVLTNQTQVNSFPTDYPGCTTIEGYVRINYVSDLTPLSQITAVDGYLQIGNNQVPNLNGLENITSVGGRLGIEGNGQLNDISALSNVTVVGGSLEVSANPALASLSGLENVGMVGGGLQITENAVLTNLQGLEGIAGIGSGIEIGENPALTSLQGLSPTSVEAYLLVRLNPLLEDLVAVQGLSSLGGGLFILGNTALTSLMDLQNITAINGTLTISQSPGLTTLDGLDMIDPATIGNLNIANCPGLSQCAVESVCSYLADPDNTSNITGNGPGCADRAEVEAACLLLSVEDAMRSDHALSIYPNPSSGLVMLKAQLHGNTVLTVLDMAGRSVHEERLTTVAEGVHTIDLSQLPPGLYTLRTQDPHGFAATRFILQ